MGLSGVRIGFGLTGSHCTIEKVLPEMEKLKKEGAEIFPILSPVVAGTDTRFNMAEEVWAPIRTMAGREPKLKLTEVGPIGAEINLVIMVVAPCTGTTLARLAMGLADTPVTLAC